MKRLFLLIPIFILVLTACGLQPNFSADDLVEIKGRFLNADGSPVARQEVGMWILTLEGLSLANYWYVDPDDYEVTDSSGNFSFLRKGEHFMTGNSANYVIIANIDSIMGPVAVVGFYPYELVNEVPTMTLWDGDPVSSLTQDSVRFDWEGKLTGDTPDYYNLSVQKVYFDLWQDSLNVLNYSAPRYVFQNFANSWRVEAVYLPDDKQTDFAYRYYTSAEPVTISSNDRLALSINKPVYAEGLGDTALTKLTNQVWHEWEWLWSVHPEYLIVDLESEKTVTSAAIYGLASAYPASPVKGGIEIYVSSDTLDWGTKLDVSAKDKGYISLDGFSKAGRYVKLSIEDGSNLQINAIKEITIFGE